MELVSLGKDMLQNLAEQAASYRPGQTVLRHLDRALWVVEKCARWAVPPPLDQDEPPQTQLVRPLPWVFFLMMLIVLRVTRETISLVNLVMGKPPLRSADVVIFFQSKRRYLRTLKYQGNRLMRARTSSTTTREPWYTSIYKLFELTMCFRKESSYGNNNTTRVSNNDEVMVVKRPKRAQQEISNVASAAEATMERLIEKMMVDLDAESDEDSSYTLTNTSVTKSDKSEATIESDLEATIQPTPTKQNGNPAQNGDEALYFSPNNVTSTPEKDDQHNNHNDSKKSLSDETQSENTQMNENSPEEVKRELENNISGIPNSKSQIDKFRENLKFDTPNNLEYKSGEDPSPTGKQALSTKQASESLIVNEQKRTPKKEHKIANGRTVKSVPNKKKGPHREKLNTNEVSGRVLTANNSF